MNMTFDVYVQLIGLGFGLYLFTYVLTLCFPKKMKLKARSKVFNFTVVGTILYALIMYGFLNGEMPYDQDFKKFIDINLHQIIIFNVVAYWGITAVAYTLRFWIFNKPFTGFYSFVCAIIALVLSVEYLSGAGAWAFFSAVLYVMSTKDEASPDIDNTILNISNISLRRRNMLDNRSPEN